jgi:hypothetical protein
VAEDDTASILDVLMKGMPLLAGRGVDLRNQAKANIAVALVREAKPPVARDALAKLWKRLSFGHAGQEALEELVGAGLELGFIAEAEEGLSLTAKAGSATLAAQIDECVPKFEKMLKSSWPEYDLHQDAGVRKAFGPCVKHMFLHVAETTLTSGASGQASFDRLAQEFEKIGKNHGVRDAHGFSDTLVIWIRNHPKDLSRVSTSLLTLVATLRLYDAQNALAKATRETIQGTCVYLDTNILVQLLCPKTSTWHATATELLEIGRRLGIEHRIFDSYCQETEELVHWTVETLEQPGGKKGWVGKTNQLLQEFADGAEGRAAFVARLRDYRGVLERNGIKVIDDPAVSWEETERFIDALASCFEANQQFPRESKAVERDGRAIQVLSSEQDASDRPFPGPWLVTFDGKLVACEQMFRAMAGGSPVTMHAATWFAGLAGLSSWAASDVDLAELAAAWVGVGIAPATSFTPEQVMKVLSAGFDLPESARLTFVRESLRSEVTREAGRRLRRRELHSIGELINAMTQRGMDALAKDVRYKEAEIARLKEKVRETFGASDEKGREGVA